MEYKKKVQSLWNAVFYPTTSPVGIVSICDPATDQLLLVRQPRQGRLQTLSSLAINMT
jgi:hypothetical protein